MMQFQEQDLEVPKVLPLYKAKSENTHAQIEDHHLKRSSSFQDDRELQQCNRNFVLVQIINMNLNPSLAKDILETMNLSEDKGILLSRVLNQIMSRNDLDPAPQTVKKEGGFKHQLLQQLKRFSSTKEEDNHYKELDEKELPDAMFTCQICLDTVSEKNTVEVKGCMDRFCRDCLVEYLKNKILVADVKDIGCPSAGCHSVIPEDCIKELVNDQQYEKYRRFLKMKILNSDEMIRWCPRGCDSYAKGAKGEKKLICPNCNVEICFKCGNVQHGFISCQDQLDASYKEAMKNYLIYPCPGCKTPIQKNDGCNHMSCQQCQYQFCWLCRRKYKAEHYSESSKLNYFFGCPGKQYKVEKPQSPIKKQILFVLAVIFIGIPGAAIALVLGALGIVLAPFTGPAVLYMIYVDRAKFNNYALSYRVFVYSMWGILGIIFYPISAGVYLGICIGYGAMTVFQCCKYTCKFLFDCLKSCVTKLRYKNAHFNAVP